MNLNPSSLVIQELKSLALEGKLAKQWVFKLGCLYTAIAYKTANGEKVSNKELANILEVSIRTIRRNKNRLVELGLMDQKIGKAQKQDNGKFISPLNTYKLLKSEYARFKKKVVETHRTVKEFLGQPKKKKGRELYKCKCCHEYKVSHNKHRDVGWCFGCEQGYRPDAIKWFDYQKTEFIYRWFWGRNNKIYLVGNL